MGVILGFILNRMPLAVGCVMLLWNPKLQVAGHICINHHSVSVASMVPGTYVCLYRDSTHVCVSIKLLFGGRKPRLKDGDLIAQSSPVST